MLTRQFASAASGLLSAVILQIALARLLGPTAFGLYGLALSVQHFGLVLQEGGYRTLIMRETARSTPDFPATPARLMRIALGHAIAATPLVAGVALLVLGVEPTLVAALLLATLGGLAKAVTSMASASLIGAGNFLREANWQILSRLALTGAGLGAALTGDAAIVLGALGVMQLALLLPALSGVSLPRPAFAMPAPVLHFTGKMMLLALLTTLYFRIGPLMLYQLSGDLVAISQFALVHRLLDAAIFMMTPVAQLVFVSTRRQEGALPPSAKLALIAAAWIVAMLLAAALGFRFGADIVALLAGEAFRPAGALAGWFALAFMLAGPNFLLMQHLLARNAEGLVLGCSGAAAVAALAIYPLLILRAGALGAAIALALCEAVLLASLVVAVVRSRRPTQSDR